MQITEEGNLTIKDYGEVLNSTIVNILQYELAYVYLEPFAKDPDNLSTLVEETLDGKEKYLTTIYVNGEKLLEEKYDYHHQSHMNIVLGELELQLERDKEDLEEQDKED